MGAILVLTMSTLSSGTHKVFPLPSPVPPPRIPFRPPVSLKLWT